MRGFDIQGNYGQGWEIVTTEETYKNAREAVRTYRDNEPGTPFRIRKESVIFELKSGDDGYPVVGEAERIPCQNSGWESVTYQGNRFQLHGGIRGPLFINIDNPIKGKARISG